MRHPVPDACARARRDLLATDSAGQPADAEVNRHLAQCDACRDLSTDLVALVAAGQAHAQASGSVEVRDSVLEALTPSIAAIAAKRARRTAACARPWLWLALGAGLATTAAVALVLRPLAETDTGEAAPIPTIVAVAGTVGDIATGEARPDAPVRTGVDGVVRYSFGKHVAVLLPSSRLRWRRPAKRDTTATAFVLDGGSFVARVDPRQATSRVPLRIDTALGRVSVTGTLLQVDVLGETLRVAVEHGEVLIETPHAETLRVRGDEVITLTGDTASRTALLEAQRADMLRWIEGNDLNAADEEEAGQRIIRAGKEPARVSTAARNARQNQSSSAFDRVLASAATGACADAEILTQTTLAGAPATAHAQALVSVADCYLATNERERALRLYATTGAQFPKTAAGQNATYEAGRLALDLGQQKRARRAFEDYLARYPRGVLAGEALFRLCSLAVDARRFDTAIRCVRRYRREQPQGERTVDTYFIEATALREGPANCRAALAAYETYLARGGERAALARQWSAWCKAQQTQ